MDTKIDTYSFAKPLLFPKAGLPQVENNSGFNNKGSGRVTPSLPPTSIEKNAVRVKQQTVIHWLSQS